MKIKEIKEIEESVIREDLIYEINKYEYSFCW